MTGKVVSHNWVVHPRGARQLRSMLKQAHSVMPATVRTVFGSAGANTGGRDLRSCGTLTRNLPGVSGRCSGQSYTCTVCTVLRDQNE